MKNSMQIKTIGLLTKDCLFSVLFEATVKCIWFRSHIFFVGCRRGICFLTCLVTTRYHYQNIVDDFNTEASDYSTGDDQ